MPDTQCTQGSSCPLVSNSRRDPAFILLGHRIANFHPAPLPLYSGNQQFELANPGNTGLWLVFPQPTSRLKLPTLLISGDLSTSHNKFSQAPPLPRTPRLTRGQDCSYVFKQSRTRLDWANIRREQQSMMETCKQLLGATRLKVLKPQPPQELASSRRGTAPAIWPPSPATHSSSFLRLCEENRFLSISAVSHICALSEDKLCCDSIKQNSQVFFFCCLELLHPRAAVRLFLCKVKCPVNVFPFFRAQRTACSQRCLLQKLKV